jgi:DNA helicase HerA-like ATPase
MLVVVDEAQLFAPAVAGEVSDEARKVSLGAMTNLMCRGRKRGLAGVIATQRLAKLAKNVAAEASNFLMGRTFLDIDMARAADLLGMERRQAEISAIWSAGNSWRWARRCRAGRWGDPNAPEAPAPVAIAVAAPVSDVGAEDETEAAAE